jgi:hypothetical protein
MPRIAIAAAALAAALLYPAPTLADGDPASDVLAVQNSFVPADAGATPDQRAQLEAVLAAARRHRYPVRVAVVAGPTDMGSVSALWRHPRSYARFLDAELAPIFRGPVLVVMPDGLGLAAAKGLGVRERASIAGSSAPGGSGLVPSASAAVARMSAAAGHPLPRSIAPVPSAPRSGSTDVTAWIAFIVGAILIVAVWTVSLKVRPLGRSAPGR